jgi:hypothetical protein
MRFVTVVISCLIFLALASAGAGRATELGSCIDSPVTLQANAESAIDCGMDQNKAHKCEHDACSGCHLVAISQTGDFSAPPAPRLEPVGSAVKHLTSSGRDYLLDPPRA